MRASTVSLQNLIKNENVVQAVPKLIAEWEHNRFSPIESLSVSPVQNPDEVWLNTYDFNSITNPNRPKTGIAKARFDTNNRLKASPKYRTSPQASRFYLASDEDAYKYWSSTQISATSISGGQYPFSTPIEITLKYIDPVVANKVVVGFDLSYATPRSITVLVSEDGVNWNNIAANPPVSAAGEIVLWANDSGSWGTAPDYNSPQLIRGLRVVVAAMSLPKSHLDVIQMGLRLENDLSDFVEQYSKDFEVSDRSVIAPMGKASSNTASVTLSNIDQRFNNENENSLYYGLIGRKVKLSLDLSYDATPTGGTANERVRQFTMWSTSWGGQTEESSVISLKDSSVLLQETPVPKVFWQNLTVGAVIWQLMDMAGMTNYTYYREIVESGQVIPYFWPEEGDTIWEQISALAEATQTAVFFDEYDNMQIKTRKSMYRPGKPVNWNLDAVQNGPKLPDIATMEQDDELVVNQVDVTYKPTKYSDFNNGLPKMEVAWEPEEDTVVLRATPLTRNLTTADQHLWISHTDAAYWPYESMINIRGEILRYRGKEYTWHRPGGTKQTVMVYSHEEKQALDDDSDPNLAWANTWTGKLAILERGVAGSGVANHVIKSAGYTGVVTSWDNNVFYPVPNGAGMNYSGGTMTLVPPRTNMLDQEYFLVKHEAVISSNDTTYGMRFRFPVNQQLANGWSTGGLFFAGDWGDSGYYLEISTSDTIENIQTRDFRNEMTILSMPGNLPLFGRSIPSDQPAVNRGPVLSIERGKWYDVDVRHTPTSGNTASITVWLNGVQAGVWTVPSHLKPVDAGKFGLFTRGQCMMEVEYLYAIKSAYVSRPDQSAFLDLVRGGFVSGHLEREWRYGSYMSSNRGPAHSGTYYFNALNSRADYAVDEFGPVVHEIREFKVNFDPDTIPVSHSYLYFSNTAQVVCLDYSAGPFGATFTLANASRHNAVLNGDDSVTFGEDNVINHKMFVYGRALYQEDDVVLTERDEPSITRNGVVSLGFDNRYIQTEDAAQEIGRWVIEQWANGSDEIIIGCFGNPIIQLGDLVTVNYPIKDMVPGTHKYYVVAINDSFSEGFETVLTLRRART